jgi:hypothetical protein
MQLGMLRNNRACRLFAMAAFLALSTTAATPASGFQPTGPGELDFARVEHTRLAAVTSGHGISASGSGANWRFYASEAAKRASIAPVWNVTEHWSRTLESSIFVDPERAARAVLGFIEIGAIYSPFKDLDFAIGLVRNPKDGVLDAMVFKIGMSARY